MILILSKTYGELSTEEVMDWLFYYNEKVLRVNGEDFINSNSVTFKLDTGERCWKFLNGINDEVTAVWYRRSFDDFIFEYDLYHGTNRDLKYLFRFLEAEYGSIYKLLELSLKNIPWLSKRTGIVNKLEVLELAVQCGLTVPNTTVINNYSEISNINTNKHGLITKPIIDSIGISEDDTLYVSFTTRVDASILDYKNNYCFPMLFQSNIDKLLELRIFYLSSNFYSMAIFSQDDKKTMADFRNYNHQNPNRFVPYRLPKRLESKLKRLMSKLKLETASIDVILNKSFEYIFLEVNPVGQFGMVSHPCNYYLEKKIAEVLINKCTYHGIFKKEV